MRPNKLESNAGICRPSNKFLFLLIILSLIFSLLKVNNQRRYPLPNHVVDVHVEITQIACTSVTNVDRRLVSGNFMYFGDSRARLLFLSHLRALRADVIWVPVRQATEKYGCPASSGKAIQLMYAPCDEIQEGCFKNLGGGVADLTLIVALGFRDALKRVGMSQRKRDFAMIVAEARKFAPRITIWVPPHPVIPPLSGGFSDHLSLTDAGTVNDLLENWTFDFINFLSAAGYHNQTNIFRIHDLLADCTRACRIYTGRPSFDGIDYWHEVYDYAIHQLLWNDAAEIELLHRNITDVVSTLVQGDLTCGTQNLQKLLGKDDLEVAAFGGSVTSDGLYINSFAAHLANLTGKNIKLHNFGEPATDSTYQSLCLEHTLGLAQTQLDLVLVEYCVNDMRPGDPNLRNLLKKLISLDHPPSVMYYCHRAPRNILGGMVMDAHWNLTTQLGLFGYRNKFMVNAALRSRSEAALFYRDDVHLNPLGADIIGFALAKGLHHCAATLVQNVSEVQFGSAPRTSSHLHDQFPGDACHTALGPPESRNLAEIVEAEEGWKFVEYEHRSAPNGKNGYESQAASVCMKIHVNISCSTDLYVFYLSAGYEDMGIAKLSLHGCTSFQQELEGFSGLGFAVTANRKIDLSPCCSMLPRHHVLRLCSANRPDDESHHKFRTIAIATRYDPPEPLRTSQR